MERVANVPHLIAAFEALSQVQDRNFRCSTVFGEPFVITPTGKCNTICNAAGWVAQHPYFTALGLELRRSPLVNKWVPYHAGANGGFGVFGYAALGMVLGIQTHTVQRVFAPYFYSTPESVTLKEVLRRLKTVITRVGGKEEFKAYVQSKKPPKAPKVKKPKVKKPKSAKAKKLAKAKRKAALVARAGAPVNVLAAAAGGKTTVKAPAAV